MTSEASAQTTATEGAPAEAKDAQAQAKDESGDKLECRDVKVTGSRIPQRVCRTARQAEAEREAARKMMDNAQRSQQTEFGH